VDLEGYNRVDLSVLIPVYNESGNITALYEKLTAVLGETGLSYEILFVDDGSTDGSIAEIEKLTASDEQVRAVFLRRNFGKSTALSVGFRAVTGTRVITMDGDQQDDPAEIPAFLAKLDEGFDMVSGWKQTRHDPISKTLPSKVWNRMTSCASGVKLHDFNCGFKAYRHEVVKTVEVYGEMHRYIPVLADRMGFRIGELPVRHHPRTVGRSKYGGSRFINGILDLLTVMFLGTSRKNPLHVFGRLGIALLAAGLLICAYMFGVWLVESALRVRPLLIGGVIMVIMGIQFISIGLIAEIIVSNNRDDEERLISRKIN
jgi:glycosyltransferase involved in cell wall biosynthesis